MRIKCWCMAACFSLGMSVIARADLVPSDDFNAVDEEGSEATHERSECALKPSISVQLLTGKMELPYGPPGFKSYRGSSNASSLRMGVLKPLCAGPLWLAYDSGIALTNFFPSSGRQYDVQAVSWTDIEFWGGVVARFSPVGAFTHALGGGLVATYERFNYSRGTFSFQTLPLSMSVKSSRRGAAGNIAYSLGLNAGYSSLLLSRTLIKYGAIPTSSRANSSVVEINPNHKLNGHEIQAGLHFGFTRAASELSARASDLPEHELTLLWSSKSRTAKAFMSETFPSNGEKNDLDLDIRLNNWILRWTEQI